MLGRGKRIKLLEQNQIYTSNISDPSDIEERTMKEEEINIGKEAFDPFHKRTLFVRFPRPVKDKEKVKDLHPGIEAVRFKRRVKRWCHIRFETEEIAKRAQKTLHKKKMEHGQLIVMETKKSAINKPLIPKETLNPHVFKIFVNSLPDEATVEDVELAFPGYKSVRVFQKNKNRKSKIATVMFRTQKEVEDTVQSKEPYKVCGADVAVSYTKCYMTANGIQKPAVKSKRNKKISLVVKAESPASSESENDEVKSDNGISDEMDTKEEDDGGDNEDGDDDNEDDDNDVQDTKGEENVESEGSDCEISDKSDSGNASSGDDNDDGGRHSSNSDENVMND